MNSIPYDENEYKKRVDPPKSVVSWNNNRIGTSTKVDSTGLIFGFELFVLGYGGLIAVMYL